ncbi:MAG: ABC transporter ATP-binding protein [Gemmatimonadaceae bacterium]
MIVANKLSKKYGQSVVLRLLDVTIRPHRVTAIVGPNGTGKTTFIKSVLGLVRPDAGELWFDGERILSDPGYRARIGYMPQIARFPENLTANEFLNFLTDLRGETTEREELIQLFNLQSQMNKQLRVLSGGTKQKVNAVAALMFAPDLYILDEPTAGLDPVAAGVMKQLIQRERARGRTIIITSHIMSEIEELADDIVYLTDGQAAFSGTVSDLRASTAQTTLERAVATLMRACEQ